MRDRAAGCRAGAAKVVVVGGTGRVGSACAARLAGAGLCGPPVLAGRRPQGFAEALAEGEGEDAPAPAGGRGARAQVLRQAGATFEAVDLDGGPGGLLAALRGADLAVHCAGPFPRRPACDVLEACLAAGVPYVDVCDDLAYARRAKGLARKAADLGIPAVTGAGLHPGLSSVMARAMIEAVREGEGAAAAGEGEAPVTPTSLRFNYFTAGSGGAGPAALATSVLRCADDAVAIKDGERLAVRPASNREVIDFGTGVGKREVFLYNLPEVTTCQELYDVPTVTARCGTSPGVYNGALQLVARLPRLLLESREFAGGLAQLALAPVRATDGLVGETASVRVDVEFSNKTVQSGVFVHAHAASAAGAAAAGFCRAVLNGETAPGVWFPEEEGAVEDVAGFLEFAREGADRLDLCQPPWKVDSNATQLGMGLYWE